MIPKVGAFLFLVSLALCTGTSCWTKSEHKNLIGLTNVDSNSLDHCLRLCLLSSSCNAVDWDVNTPRKCFIQQQSLEVSTSRLKVAPTVTDFILDRRCYAAVVGSAGTSDTDTICWTVSPGRQLFGLTNLENKSLPECLRECERRKDCRAVDWDKDKGQSCFVQTNQNLEVSVTKLAAQPSVTNHILNRDCLEALLLDGSV